MAKMHILSLPPSWFSFSWSEVFIEHTSDSTDHGQDIFEIDADGKQTKFWEPVVFQTFATGLQWSGVRQRLLQCPSSISATTWYTSYHLLVITPGSRAASWKSCKPVWFWRWGYRNSRQWEDMMGEANNKCWKEKMIFSKFNSKFRMYSI